MPAFEGLGKVTEWFQQESMSPHDSRVVRWLIAQTRVDDVAKGRGLPAR